MFWALNEQTSSLFPLQATRMNGHLGFYTVKPDQIQLIMQILVMAFIPLCDLLIYPMLSRVGIKTVFHRITFAGILSFGAFVIAGVLEMQINASSTPLHMIWILPSIVMLALVEAIIGVLSMVFANAEAPTSLRTVIQASFLTSHGLGNLYDVVVFSIFTFSNQVREPLTLLLFLFLINCFLVTHLFLVRYINVWKYAALQLCGISIQAN